MADRDFDAWIRELEEDVIEGEYGFERGEFTVFPEHWRPMFRKGLTPQQAYRRALDAFAKKRSDDAAARVANWERIKAADAAHARLENPDEA